MLKKVSLLLPVLAVLLFMEIKGNPLNKANENVDPKNSESSKILPQADWLNFHNTWTLPSLPSVTSFFYNKEKTGKEAGTMKTRIEALEQSQEDIIKILKKITQDLNSNLSPCTNKKPNIVLPEKHKEEPILPTKPANNGKDKTNLMENPVVNENPDIQKSVKLESPINDKKDDEKLTIQKVLKETASKSENRLAASEEIGKPIKFEVNDTYENITLLGSVP